MTRQAALEVEVRQLRPVARGEADDLPGDLQAKKVALYLHQQALHTSTPSGKAMFGMQGVFGEFVRAIIRERVKAGLARARANGKTLGRPERGAAIERRIRDVAAQGWARRRLPGLQGSM